MRVRDNWLALVSWRGFASSNSRVDRNIARLSSGLAINSAADNVAGHGISERFKTQFMGLMQANRNAMDGLSLVQTAEAALDEVTSLLQRGRELALQATNGVWTTDDRKTIQTELTHVLAEIDRLADTATFNENRLLTPFANSGLIANLMNGLQTSWLRETERIVREQYGIIGDGSSLRIVFETTGSDASWISGQANNATGKLDQLALHINLDEMDAFGGPDGGTGPIYNDRKVSRALTLAILARNTNYSFVDEWFKSGIADYVAGRNELLQADIAQFSASAVVNAMSDALSGTWVDDSLHRSSAYLAMRYLRSQLSPATLSDFMNIVASPGGSVDAAMNAILGISSSDFFSDFLANGENFLSGLTLDGPDVGGIAGGDASAVIPNPASPPPTPLENFSVDWDLSTAAGGNGAGLNMKPMDFTLQVGANQGDTLTFSIPVISTLTLGLIGVDVVNGAAKGVEQISSALNIVSSARAGLGSVANRLEHVMNSNNQASISGQSSYSRIRDLDVAAEVAELTRNQILVSSTGAMLAQANTVRQNVMWLLNGVASSRGTVFGF